MSDDEVGVLIISLVVAAISWAIWLARVLTLSSRRQGGVQLWLWGTPLMAFLATMLVLVFWSAEDVRTDSKYIFFYSVLAAAWVGVLRLFTPLYGISARDDALERRNVAAAAAWFGAVLGYTICFAGGNIGDGPGWWVVIYSAVLATGSLMVLWAIYERLTGVSDIITIERDLAGGLRLAGWLIASAIVLGAAVAGDWKSAADTNRDFMLRGWPALLLIVTAIAIERLGRPTPDRPRPNIVNYGIVPFIAYVLLACTWVAFIGLDT